MRILFKYSLVLLSFCFLFVGCQQSNEPKEMANEEVEANLQRRLIEAKPGETILLPAGTFNFKRSLSFNDVEGVSIIGAGMNKTVLSFKNQIEGAEGISAKSAKDLLLQGFSIEDTKGDAIKVMSCTNITIRDVETTWTGGALSSNGAYGLYPVSCTNVLMEECEASYASDAGIYLGQSTNAIVRNNYVHHNVAGLEIENTLNAEVYENVAKENTGGMLIFDMPDLPQANGGNVVFYNNLMENNNHPNFAPPGIIVGTLPAGFGMLIMSTTGVEAYGNTIKNHKSFGIGLNSWFITEKPFESKEFDPYCTNINIHDNIIEDVQGPPDSEVGFGKMLTALFGGESYDIIVDGVYKPGHIDENGNPTGICFRNNGDVSFINMNMAKGTGMGDIMTNMNNDASLFDCENEKIELDSHDEWLSPAI